MIDSVAPNTLVYETHLEYFLRHATIKREKYKVVQIWPGQTVTCLHTNSPGHIWTTLYLFSVSQLFH